MTKERLDVLMVNAELVESRSVAQRLVMAGQVRVNGQVVLKAGNKFPTESRIEIDHGPRFVSRGGDKLDAAIKAFQLTITDKVCADLGASTGGFTDCLLQHGACHVYAIDVGKGILHWKLRQDTRVTVMEGTNARYLAKLPEPVELVTIDASFISLRILLPVVKKWFLLPDEEHTSDAGHIIALIKPQFEAGRTEVSRGGGVIRDPAVHQQVLHKITAYLISEGYQLRGLLRSPVHGQKGNIEFLTWLTI